MPAPPPLLGWIAVIGGLVAIVKEIVELIGHWAQRKRIAFRLHSAITYYERWSEGDYEKHMASFGWPKADGAKGGFEPGDYRFFYTILEFSIENHYANDVSVGRFLINNWIYSSKYSPIGPQLVYNKRDYRVFDLYTRQPTDLQQYTRLGPGGVLSLRIEVVEEACGPQWGSHRGVYRLPSTHYQVKYRTSVGNRKQDIEPTMEPWQATVYRWSEILGSDRPTIDISKSGPPQDVNPWSPPTWLARLLGGMRSRVNYLLYGTGYALPGQRSRLSNLLKRVRRPPSH